MRFVMTFLATLTLALALASPAAAGGLVQRDSPDDGGVCPPSVC
jgi:hypothetical protein